MHTGNNKELRHRILVTANRLRMIQADFADEEPQVRSAYLREEIETALQKVLPATRREFLEALTAKFPTGDFTGSQVLQQPKSAIHAEIRKDPDYLVDLLLSIVPSLTAEKRKAIAERLRKEGIGRQEQMTCSEESLKRLRSALKLGDAVRIDTDRLVDLAVLLAEFVGLLEPLVGRVWRNLAPQSKVRISADVMRSLRQLFSGDKRASTDDAAGELVSLRQLIASIIAAIGQVGNQFGRRHIGKFSPSEIAALAHTEGAGGILVSSEVKCWRKYRELASNLTEDSIDLEIRVIIANYVESLMKQTGG